MRSSLSYKLKEVLVQVQVGVVAAAAHAGPVHRADHAHEQVQGDPEVGCHVVGEQLQRLAHQGMLMPERGPDLVQGLPGHVDAFGACQQQGERDRLGVPVGECGVAGLGKQQRTPVAGQAGERLGVFVSTRCDGLPLGGELVDDLSAQEPGERCHCPHQRGDRRDRCRLPAQEVGQQALQLRAEPAASSRLWLGRRLKGDRPGQQFAIPVQPPVGAVGVDQIRQVTLPLPLELVMPGEP